MATKVVVYSIKAYKAREIRIHKKIIPAKVRAYPPQPGARNE